MRTGLVKYQTSCWTSALHVRPRLCFDMILEPQRVGCRVLLAVGSVDNSVRLLLAPPGSGFAPACRLTGHADWVRSLAFQRAAGAHCCPACE